MISIDRTLILKLLHDTLHKWTITTFISQPTERINKIIEQIELGCYNATVEIAENEKYDMTFGMNIFTVTYSCFVNKLVNNLSYDNKNEYLISKIMNDEVDLLTLAKMSAEELCPSANKGIRAEIEIRQQQRIEKNVSTLYTCPRCKHNRTTLRIQQTRALDEGSTLIIKCDNCEHTWAKS